MKRGWRKMGIALRGSLIAPMPIASKDVPKVLNKIQMHMV
jgi:hypothetical protein